MRGAPAHRGPVLRTAWAVAAVLLAATACSDDDAPAASGDPARDVGAELLSSRDDTSGAVPLSPRAPTEGSARPNGETRQKIDIAPLGHDVGAEDAPLRVLEFADFGCGYCRQFHTETWPTLHERYVETGKVLWKTVPMVLGTFGPNSEDAALAAECAGRQDRFYAVADGLFEEQGRWKRAGEPAEVFSDIVRDTGADMGEWEACMQDGGLRDRVEDGTTLSRQLGVRGTPTFFIVGYGSIPGAIPLDLFTEVLDSAYALSTGPDGPSR